LAVECRQRVKDQLSALSPGEYSAYDIEFEIAGPAGERRRHRNASGAEPFTCHFRAAGRCGLGLAVASGTYGTLQLIEIVAQKGHGALHRLGRMSADMKESVQSGL